MRTLKSKLFLAIAGLLLAGMLAPDMQLFTPVEAAQNVNQSLNRARNAGSRTRNATNRAARSNRGANEGPLANIAENWYVEFTPGYIKAGNADLSKFYGASFVLGYKLTLEDKIQLEIGFYTSSKFTNNDFRYDRNFTYDRKMEGSPAADEVAVQGVMKDIRGQAEAKARLKIPVLLSYSYCVRLDSRERWELRLTPAAGFICMFDTWKIRNATGTFNDTGGNYLIRNVYSPVGTYQVVNPDAAGYGRQVSASESFSGSNSGKWVFAMGGGFGLTWHFADRWHADAGYRWLWTDKISAKIDPVAGTHWNGIKAWNGMNTHTYTAALGWKF